MAYSVFTPHFSAYGRIQLREDGHSLEKRGWTMAVL